MTGTLPPTDALAEASPNSLSELFSRDPEGYTEADLTTIVTELRGQRERFAVKESAPKVRAPRAPGATLASRLKQIVAEGISAEDLLDG